MNVTTQKKDALRNDEEKDNYQNSLKNEDHIKKEDYLKYEASQKWRGHKKDNLKGDYFSKMHTVIDIFIFAVFCIGFVKAAPFHLFCTVNDIYKNLG